MKISIHAGHNPDGKKACGSVGYLKESTENRTIVKKLKTHMKRVGFTVYDDTVNNGITQNDVLNKIVSNIRKHKVDIVISIHFNAYVKENISDGKRKGTEIWAKKITDEIEGYSHNILNAISSLGFPNRGLKQTDNLYILNAVNDTPAILIECCFVDDIDDYNLYNAKKMAGKIAEGLFNGTLAYEDICVRTKKKIKVWSKAKYDKKYLIGKTAKDSVYKITKVEYSYPYLFGKTTSGKYIILKNVKGA